MVLLSLVISHVRIGFPLAALPYAMYFCFFVTFAHNGQEYTARERRIRALGVYSQCPTRGSTGQGRSLMSTRVLLVSYTTLHWYLLNANYNVNCPLA